MIKGTPYIEYTAKISQSTFGDNQFTVCNQFYAKLVPLNSKPIYNENDAIGYYPYAVFFSRKFKKAEPLKEDIMCLAHNIGRKEELIPIENPNLFIQVPPDKLEEVKAYVDNGYKPVQNLSQPKAIISSDNDQL